MKRLTLVLALISTNAWSFGDSSFSVEQEIQKPLTPVGSNLIPKPEPFVQVERYQAPDYKNDPQVLISTPNKQVIKPMAALPTVADHEVIITSWMEEE